MTTARMSCVRVRTTTGRRLLMLWLAALVSCFMLIGTSEAVGKATATTSTTRAQKLSKALKACKKQPKKKRAACVKRARKKYGTHHPVTQLPATTPTAPVTTPAAPAAPVTAPAGPSGPTQEWLQQQVERFAAAANYKNLQILNLNILARGTPHLGTGVAPEYGGDGVPSTSWVYPLLYSYDQTYQLPGKFNSSTGTFETFTQTEHWRTRGWAQLDPFGRFELKTEGSNCTSAPIVETCHAIIGKGA